MSAPLIGEQTLGGIGRAASSGRPAHSGPRLAAARRRRRDRRREPLPGAGDRGGAMFPIAAEELVGALARERDGDLLAASSESAMTWTSLWTDLFSLQRKTWASVAEAAGTRRSTGR